MHCVCIFVSAYVHSLKPSIKIRTKPWVLPCNNSSGVSFMISVSRSYRLVEFEYQTVETLVPRNQYVHTRFLTVYRKFRSVQWQIGIYTYKTLWFFTPWILLKNVNPVRIRTSIFFIITETNLHRLDYYSVNVLTRELYIFEPEMQQ